MRPWNLLLFTLYWDFGLFLHVISEVVSFEEADILSYFEMHAHPTPKGPINIGGPVNGLTVLVLYLLVCPLEL